MVSDMSRKSLSTLIFFLFVTLGIVLLSSDRGVSGVMEDIGNLLSRLFV
jgi:hypothetical protein